ncbi:ABC transporter permease [Caballeronia sp. LjRoot34]|uniref:ABC transporter permease n=1 Tax=Caballeronia sp. LjRoot34 TaxID=3342325 RepID=UPI003ECFFCD9
MSTGTETSDDRPASRRTLAAQWKLFAVRHIGWFVVGLLLVVWQVLAGTVPGLAQVLPPVDHIVVRAAEVFTQGSLLVELGDTLAVMAVGYLIGSVAGIVMGTLIGRSRVAYYLFEPLIELTRPIPIAAIVPLLMLFLGLGAGLKIGAVTITAFFPVLMNTYAAFRSTPRTLDETARTFGLPPLQSLLKVALPHAVPAILVGMRLSLAISLVVTVFTEMIAGNSGVGYFILNSQQNMSIVDLYVGVLTLAIVGYLLNRAFVFAERRIVPWHISNRRPD